MRKPMRPFRHDVTFLDRLLAKFTVGDDCWVWHGSTTLEGYGMFYAGPGQRRPAHRAVYELLEGPIPDGLEPDHLCRNRACVNPAHIELVTHSENVRRGWIHRARKAAV